MIPALKQAIRDAVKCSPGKKTSSARSPAFKPEEFRK